MHTCIQLSLSHQSLQNLGIGFPETQHDGSLCEKSRLAPIVDIYKVTSSRIYVCMYVCMYVCTKDPYFLACTSTPSD